MSILAEQGYPHPDLDQIHVLHVDDDPGFAEIASESLQRVDDRFNVDAVKTVAEGLDLLAEREFDCVISDYSMPDQTGIEFLETVREEHGDLPFILFTGKGSEEVASHAISSGVTDYVQKQHGTDQYVILANRVRNAVERIWAQRDRQALYDRMELILDHTDIVLFEVDLETGEVAREGDFEDFFHRPATSLPTWKDHLDHAVHPDDYDRFRRFFQQLTDGERHTGEIVYRTNPEIGEVRWIRDTVYVKEGPDANRRRAVGLAHDITERKQEQEERERLLSRSTEAIVKVDENWRFTLVNDRAEEIYEMSEDYLLGRQFWDVFSCALGTRFEEEYRRVMETRESTSFEEYYSKLDGWFEINVYPKDDGGLAFYFRDISDRREYQQTIERERAFTRTALNTLEDVFFLFDETGSFERWNDRLNEVTGYTDEEIESMHPTDFFRGDDVSRISDSIEECLETGETAIEAHIVTKDGESIPYEFRARRLTGQDKVTSIVGIGRDITEHKQRDERLIGLNETLAEYLEADTKQDLFQTTIEAACERLRLPVTTIALYDAESGSLQLTAQTPAVQNQLDVECLLDREGIAWQAFASGEPEVRDASDLDCVSTTFSAPHLVTLPLGKHGVMITVVPASDGVPTDEKNFIQTVSGAFHDAMKRIEGEEKLHEREELLEQQNHRLNKLDRINDVIRDIQNVIIQASTRGEIVENVTESLSSVDPYAFAWIGEFDHTNSLVQPTSWAGIDTESIDPVSEQHDSIIHHLANRAASTDRVVVEHDLLDQSVKRVDRKWVLEQGGKSVAAVPIFPQGKSYILFLHGQSANEFEASEREILEELGTAIEYGIQNAVQTTALDSPERIKLEMQIDDPQFICSRLSTAIDGRIDYRGGLSQEDGRFTAFFNITAESDDWVEEISQWETIDSITEISRDDDSGIYQIQGPIPPMITSLWDVNGKLLSLSSDADSSRLTVELLPCTDIRAFVEELEKQYSNVELLSQQHRTTQCRSHDRPQVPLQEILTERQFEAIEAAHYSGFYEWPRETTTEDLAATLDISSSTYQYHLRAAEQKVVESILE